MVLIIKNMFFKNKIIFDIFNNQQASKFRHRRKNSVEIDNGKLQNEFDNDGAAPIGDADHANPQSNLEAHYSPSTSQQVQDPAHNHQITSEEWAAICIQTAFRGFLVIYHVILFLFITTF